VDAVQAFKRQHPMGAPRFRVVFVVKKTVIPEAGSTFLLLHNTDAFIPSVDWDENACSDRVAIEWAMEAGSASAARNPSKRWGYSVCR